MLEITAARGLLQARRNQWHTGVGALVYGIQRTFRTPGSPKLRNRLDNSAPLADAGSVAQRQNCGGVPIGEIGLRIAGAMGVLQDPIRP